MTMQKPNSRLRKIFRKSLEKSQAPEDWRVFPKRPELTTSQVLAWADAHHARTGRWPTRRSGKVHEEPQESWEQICNAIIRGFRGFPGGSTLQRLLFETRGLYYRRQRSELTIREINKWADAHYVCHGRWPNSRSGTIPGSGDVTWARVCNWLRKSDWLPEDRRRLDRLLADRRLPRARRRPAELTIAQILNWADAYFAAKGGWPNARSRGARKLPGVSWQKIDAALRQGLRGLPGGTSLDDVLRDGGRGVRNQKLPRRTWYAKGRGSADARNVERGRVREFGL